MATPSSFGRRNSAPAQPASKAREPRAAHAALHAPDVPSVEEEVEAWKRTRGGLRMPWRQIALMAGLCFGIASFVLPDSVSDAVEWVLYGASAVSFFLGLRGRIKI